MTIFFYTVRLSLKQVSILQDDQIKKMKSVMFIIGAFQVWEKEC